MAGSDSWEAGDYYEQARRTETLEGARKSAYNRGRRAGIRVCIKLLTSHVFPKYPAGIESLLKKMEALLSKGK